MAPDFLSLSGTESADLGGFHTQRIQRNRKLGRDLPCQILSTDRVLRCIPSIGKSWSPDGPICCICSYNHPMFQEFQAERIPSCIRFQRHPTGMQPRWFLCSLSRPRHRPRKRNGWACVCLRSTCVKCFKNNRDQDPKRMLQHHS